MISKDEMAQFLNWREVPQSSVLSVYLNIEASGEEVLHRRFETSFKALIQLLRKEVPAGHEERFEADVKRVRQFIAGYEPSGQSLVIFCNESQNYFWARELRIHVPQQAYWLGKPYMLPLLEALDEYERYGVILADKSRARVFTYCLGEIEEEKGALAWNDVHHIKTAGKDNLRSAFKLERTAELHVEWHLKHVVELAEDLVKRSRFERLILAGPKEAVEEVSELLPLALQLKVAGRLSLAVDTHEKELLAALQALEKEVERDKELKLVRMFTHRDPNDTHRVAGLDGVLLHLNKGQVHQLIYSENFKNQGSRCRGCGHFFSNGRMLCGRCGAEIVPLAHLMEETARFVLQKGGVLEEVRGQAALEMDKLGGIAALLKTK